MNTKIRLYPITLIASIAAITLFTAAILLTGPLTTPLLGAAIATGFFAITHEVITRHYQK